MRHHVWPPGLRFTTMLLGLAIPFCGCSSSYSVSSAGKPDAEYSYREMNEVVNGRGVTIEVTDNGEISAEEVMT
jgi:hypothetical protein